MRVVTASSPRARGRANEDFVGAAAGVVVLLDGAGMGGTDEVCRHGVAWYAHTLGPAVLSRLSPASDLDLAAALGDAIEDVTSRHRGTCDVADPRSPQAMVAIARVGDGHVDHLVLADAFVVLDRRDETSEVVTDPREVEVRRACTSALDGVPSGTPEHTQVLASVVSAFRARRNREGGYWIAKDDPESAARAVVGRVAVDGLAGVALLSNGVTPLVHPSGPETWSSLLTLARTAGPAHVLRRLRTLERDAGPAGSRLGDHVPDDATLAYAHLD